MKTPTAIKLAIKQIPLGEPFTTSSLLGHGSRAAVDQTLSRLVRAGRLERLTRGVFVRPATNPHVGRVLPGPWQVVRALARDSGEIVTIHGAEAARRFGLTTQVQTRPVFLTSGTSRRIRIGKVEVELRRVSPRKLALAGRPAGTALAALWYLGKEHVSPETIGLIEEQLPPDEFRALEEARAAMPSWMIAAFRAHEAGRTHG